MLSHITKYTFVDALESSNLHMYKRICKHSMISKAVVGIILGFAHYGQIELICTCEDCRNSCSVTSDGVAPLMQLSSWKCDEACEEEEEEIHGVHRVPAPSQAC